MEKILARGWRVSIASMCVLLALSSNSALAQTVGSSATISGVVLDPAGKVVPDAAVVVTNDLTAIVRSVTTSAEDRFSVTALPVGTYSIEVSSPGFTTARSTGLQLAANGLENISIALSVARINEEVTVSEFLPLAATLAPSQSSLDARSAQSVISPEYIQNFTSPTADYTEVVQMAPGTFSFSPNGAGLGDSKTFFRGFSDGDYTMTFDGIPFNDTNSPTHHSWAFFPGQFIGQTVFDRSPGSASTIGPTNFGGSINMMSPNLRPDQNVRATLFLWLVQHAPVRSGVQLRPDWQVELLAGCSPDEIGWISDLQLSAAQCILDEVPVCILTQDGADCVYFARRVEVKHSEHEGTHARPGG